MAERFECAILLVAYGISVCGLCLVQDDDRVGGMM